MIAREGYGIIIGSILLTLAIFLVSLILSCSSLKIIRWSFLIVLIFMVWFFRDPEREIPEQAEVVSPADGKIIAVDRVQKEDREYKRISIFMSILNVHVNRTPCSGEIIDKEYVEGKFLPAFDPKSSGENERCKISIKKGDHLIFVTQIAGLVARKIVNNFEKGQEVRVGDKMGIIKFGSRVDLEIPMKYDTLVQTGQKVKAGATELAKFEHKT